MLKAIAFSICGALLLRATYHAAELAENTAFGTAPSTSPDFESLRIKGLTIALPGPQDTIDPDLAGIRSSLAALGIGYIGYSCPQNGPRSASRSITVRSRPSSRITLCR
jgi:porin